MYGSLGSWFYSIRTMNVDIISQHCVFNDYPIFRYNIQRYRSKFKKVILYPSRHHGVIDLESWLKKSFGSPVTWVDPVSIDYGVEDWRQAETTPCLKQSTAEWIWFTEQDFFVDNWDWFFETVEDAMRTHDAVGWWNETAFPYIHPCSFFIKRELLEKTQKDFRAHPEIPGCDHFAMITRDIEKIGGKIARLQDMGWKNWDSAFHLGGLTYPYQNWKGDGTDHFGVGNVEAFYVYDYWSRMAPVFQSDDYINLSKKVGKTLEQRFPRVNPEDNRWTKFFRLW